MKIRILAFGLLLAARAAFAADVDGKWSGPIDTPNGPVTVTYVFKAEGTKLTGTTTGPDGSPLTIKEGKLDGNKVAFSLDISFGADPVTFNYIGTLTASEMKLHTEFMGQAIDFTLKKAG
jgi:hypothetical protein